MRTHSNQIIMSILTKKSVISLQRVRFLKHQDFLIMNMNACLIVKENLISQIKQALKNNIIRRKGLLWQ